MQQQENAQTNLRLSTKNGPLAQIWLASNMTIINRNVAKTDIVQSVQEIAKVTGIAASNDESILESVTLRASGELLHGVVRVYSQQASFLLGDISDLLAKVKSIFKGSVTKVGTLKTDTVARVDQLLLEDAVTEQDVLMVPSLDFLEDVEIPVGLLQGERSMERQVQGAAAGSQVLADQAAWDLSLEVGRRFLQEDFDEDLGRQDTSHLDLNFDLGESNEGTRTNAKSWSGGTSSLDDDLPPVTDDWDLAFHEENVGNEDTNTVRENDNDGSVELGRRLDIDNTLQDASHLDIDLGLPKDFSLQNENENTFNEVENVQVEPLNIKPKSRRNKKNDALLNVKKVALDNVPELADSDVKEGPSSEILIDDIQDSVNTTVSRKKRSINDLLKEDSFLPSSITSWLLQPDWNKKQRKLVQSHQDESELELDISLGIDESLAPVSDPLDHQQEIENDTTIDVQNRTTDYDIRDAETMDINDYSGIEQDDFSSESNSQGNDKNNKIEIKTGEMVSKSTMQMASILRDNLHNGISSFDTVLKMSYPSETTISKKMVCKTFFEILSLATSDCIKLSQQETFGDIQIESKSNLYEKFIPA